jgi:hypothetical protein
MVSPFQFLSKSSEKKLSIILFVFVVLMVVIMRYFDAPLKNETSPQGIVSFEMAKDINRSVEIIESWDRAARVSADWSMVFDFLFLVVYGLFIGLLIHKLNRSWIETSFHSFGIVLIYLVFLASFFDIIENIALILLLRGSIEQIWSSVAYYFAIMKFIILAVALLFVIVSAIKLLVNKNKSTLNFI